MSEVKAIETDGLPEVDGLTYFLVWVAEGGGYFNDGGFWEKAIFYPGHGEDKSWWEIEGFNDAPPFLYQHAITHYMPMPKSPEVKE